MGVEIVEGVKKLGIDANGAAKVTQVDSAGNEIIQSLPIAIAVSNVTAVNNDLISTLDVSAYKFVSIQLAGTWVGEVRFQGSIDNGTFFDIAVQNPSALSTPYITSLSTIGMVKIPTIFKYLRVRVTAYTSGTVEGVAYGYKEENSTGQISSTGEVTIADADGLIVGPLKVGLDSQNHLPTACIQDVFVSTSNSTEVNLDAAQIFTGPAQSIKGVNSIDLSAACNENLTIQIQQSHDGIDFDHEDVYLLAGGTETHRNFKALSAFFRVRVTNTSASTTTSLHVNISLTPISEVLPSALTQLGNLKASVSEMGGERVSMGPGAADAGTQRVVLPDGNVNVVIKPGASLISGFILGAGGIVSVNSANVVNAPCILRAITFTSYAATPRHLKLYNTAGVPVAGSAGVLLQCSMASPGTLVYPLPVEGFTFSNGIGRTATVGAAENDTTPMATAPDFSVSYIYQLI